MSNAAHRTILLIRHAKAEDRMKWNRPDRERPLTRKGERQAMILAELLGQEPIGRIMSSPALRCVQTVEPLSAALGVSIGIEDDLFEGHRIHIPEDEGTHVICAHGDNIPDLLTRLNVDYDACQKGSVWKVVLEGDRVVAATYIRPPNG